MPGIDNNVRIGNNSQYAPEIKTDAADEATKKAKKLQQELYDALLNETPSCSNEECNIDTKISELAAKINVNKQDLIKSILNIYSLQNIDDLTNEKFSVINAILLVAHKHIKDNKSSSTNILKLFDEYVDNLKTIGVKNEDIVKFLSDNDKSNLFIEKVKISEKGLSKEDEKIELFFSILKRENTDLSDYSSLKEALNSENGKSEIEKTIKAIIRKQIESFKNNDNSDKLQIQINVVKYIINNAPPSVICLLYTAINDIFKENEVMIAAANTSLLSCNNENQKDNLDSLIKILRKYADSETDLVKKAKLDIIINQFSDVGQLTEDVRGIFKANTEDEKAIAFSITNKLRNLIKEKYPESFADVNNIDYATIINEIKNDLSDSEKAFLPKYEKQFNSICEIILGITNNQRYNTTEEAKQKGIENVYQCLEENGYNSTIVNYNIKHMIDAYKEVFEGISIDQIYDAINKYTNNEFGNDTGCWGENAPEGAKTAPEPSAANDNGVGFYNNTPSELVVNLRNGVNDKIQQYYSNSNNVDEENTVIKDDANTGSDYSVTPWEKFSAVTNLTGSELFEGLSNKYIKISDVLAKYEELTKSGQELINNLVEVMSPGEQNYWLRGISSKIIINFIRQASVDPDKLGENILSTMGFYARNEIDDEIKVKNNNLA